MTTYARMVGSEAVDVITTDPAETFHADIAAEFVTVPDGTTPGSVKHQDGTWTAAPPWTPPAPAEVWVSLAGFYGLFTLTEVTAHDAVIDSVVPADATSTNPARQAAAAYKAWTTVLNRSQQVNLKDARLPQGLALARTVGVLSSDSRVAEILANQPPS